MYQQSSKAVEIRKGLLLIPRKPQTKACTIKVDGRVQVICQLELKPYKG